MIVGELLRIKSIISLGLSSLGEGTDKGDTFVFDGFFGKDGLFGRDGLGLSGNCGLLPGRPGGGGGFPFPTTPTV